MKKRVAAPHYQKRQYPRVLLHTMVVWRSLEEDGETAGGQREGSVLMLDFNYCYVSLSGTDIPKRLVLFPVEGVELKCVFDTELRDKKLLYLVKNREELVHDKGMMERILPWLKEENRKAVCENEQKKKGTPKKPPKKHEFNEMELLQ